MLCSLGTSLTDAERARFQGILANDLLLQDITTEGKPPPPPPPKKENEFHVIGTAMITDMNTILPKEQHFQYVSFDFYIDRIVSACQRILGFYPFTLKSA